MKSTAKTRRAICLLAVLALAFCLVGCGGKELTEAPDLYTGTQGGKTVVVNGQGFVQSTYSLDDDGNIVKDGKIVVAADDVYPFVAVRTITVKDADQMEFTLDPDPEDATRTVPTEYALEIAIAPVNNTCKAVTVSTKTPYIVTLGEDAETINGVQSVTVPASGGVAKLTITCRAVGTGTITFNSADGKAVTTLEVSVTAKSGSASSNEDPSTEGPSAEATASPEPTASATPAPTATPVPAPVPTMYATERNGYVSASRVVMRNAPNGDAILELDRNTVVTVLGECDGWYLCKYNTTTGYIIDDYLALGVASTTPTPDINIDMIDDIIDGRGDPWPVYERD